MSKPATRYEPVQKGNPRRLSVRQHTMPAKSIQRFTDTDGTVTVVLNDFPLKPLRVPPRNSVFCAKRAWDHHAESVLMKRIEDSFQDLCEVLLADPTQEIPEERWGTIADFVFLCNRRAAHRAAGIPDADLRPSVVQQEYSPTKDEQELLESEGIGFVRPDLTIPGRLLAGSRIQLELIVGRKTRAKIRWGIARALSGTLILPDRCTTGILPIAPTIALMPHQGNSTLSKAEVLMLNKRAALGSLVWTLARDLDAFPIWP